LFGAVTGLEAGGFYERLVVDDDRELHVLDGVGGEVREAEATEDRWIEGTRDRDRAPAGGLANGAQRDWWRA
jgi:hypothetical protein